jgi:hypothetical protein
MRTSPGLTGGVTAGEEKRALTGSTFGSFVCRHPLLGALGWQARRQAKCDARLLGRGERLASWIGWAARGLAQAAPSLECQVDGRSRVEG